LRTVYWDQYWHLYTETNIENCILRPILRPAYWDQYWDLYIETNIETCILRPILRPVYWDQYWHQPWNQYWGQYTETSYCRPIQTCTGTKYLDPYRDQYWDPYRDQYWDQHWDQYWDPYAETSIENRIETNIDQQNDTDIYPIIIVNAWILTLIPLHVYHNILLRNNLSVCYSSSVYVSQMWHITLLVFLADRWHCLLDSWLHFHAVRTHAMFSSVQCRSSSKQKQRQISQHKSEIWSDELFNFCELKEGERIVVKHSLK